MLPHISQWGYRDQPVAKRVGYHDPVLGEGLWRAYGATPIPRGTPFTMQGTWMRSLGQAGPGSSLLANEGLWCYHGLALNIEGRTRGSDRGLGRLPRSHRRHPMTHRVTEGILALSHSALG